MELKPAGKINGANVYYGHHIAYMNHHGYLPERIGRIDGDRGNDDINNLYDMTYGKPITDAMAVPNCRMYAIYKRFPLITERETSVIQKPLTDFVREQAIGFFRSGAIFVPMGDAVADKLTGAIRLRRFVIERLVAEDILCYEDECYKLTYQAT